MKYTLTYNDAHLIAQRYNNFNFAERLFNVEGYKVAVFDYFLCDFNHFENPIKEEPHIKAYDMRGSCFVFNTDGTLFASYYMLPKFFNLNQVANTQYDKLKNKKVVNVSTKEDGTLIGFMKLPNGNIFCKTIGGIGNEQSIEAFKIYNANEKLKAFIINCLNNNYTPLFEYVSYSNRIVLQYNKPQLKFLGLRNNIHDCEYISNAKLQFTNVDYAPFDNTKTLDQLIELSKILQDFEGWVVEFDDGQLIKIKTQWYFDKHYLRTENIFREDYIVKQYLEEKLDDVICQLNPDQDADALEFIEIVKKATDNWSTKIDKDTDDLMLNYTGDLKEFAIKYHKDYAFQFCTVKIRNGDYKKYKINYMLQKAYRLQEARFFIDKFKNK